MDSVSTGSCEPLVRTKLTEMIPCLSYHTEPVDHGRYVIVDESRNSPLAGGNKIRKLCRIIGSMEPKGLLTLGTPFSNHCLAVAYWGATRRVPVRLLILTDRNTGAATYPNLAMAKSLGAELVFIAHESAERRIAQEISEYQEYMWIPGGGHSREGLEAYRDWFLDLMQQHPALKAREWVAVAYGTGTTALGILASIEALALDIQVIGISVARVRERCIYAALELVSHEDIARLKIDDRFAGRYGVREAHHEELRLSFLRKTGILVDPIYNIRVVEFLEAENLENGIIVHTGGQLNNLLPT